MEEIPKMERKISQPCQQTMRSSQCPSKYITSLPYIPSPAYLSKRNSNQQLQSSNCQSNNEILQTGNSSKEHIYAQIYSFIQDIINNPSQHFNILKRFEQIQAQIKINLKKSVKIFPTKRYILRSMKNSINQFEMSGSLEQEKKDKRGKIKFKDQSQQSISIKLINSRRNDINKDSIVSAKENISLANLLTFKDRIVLEEIQSQESIQAMNETIQDQNHSSSGHLKEQAPRLQMSFRKVSILMLEDNQDKESEIFSQQSNFSLKDVDLPNLKLSQELIKQIFDSPSPFLINLSLCLLFKFFMKSKFQPKIHQIGWLLGVATIVAYKLFVDETIEGLVEYYSQILSIKSGDLLRLERWFLSGIKYEVLISNKHYLQMLTRVAAATKQLK